MRRVTSVQSDWVSQVDGSKRLVVSHDGVTLMNAANTLEWGDGPVQFTCCEHCWTVGCASSGWVHVSRAGDHVLVTPPHVDEPTWCSSSSEFDAIGGVALTAAVWRELRSNGAVLPEFEALHLANSRVVLDAVRLLTTPEAESADELIEIVQGGLVACSTLETDPAISLLTALLARLEPSEPLDVTTAIRAASEVGATVEVLFVDRATLEEWPVLARVGERWGLALGGELVWDC